MCSTPVLGDILFLFFTHKVWKCGILRERLWQLTYLDQVTVNRRWYHSLVKTLFCTVTSFRSMEYLSELGSKLLHVLLQLGRLRVIVRTILDQTQNSLQSFHTLSDSKHTETQNDQMKHSPMGITETSPWLVKDLQTLDTDRKSLYQCHCLMLQTTWIQYTVTRKSK